ncbi:CaiB/BaiF CoA-transferase family protein [Flammeovirga sp. SJP92]|uniref:CaiB/BaiF CoA transferase family protein n=1 Tax=Flammeovirga sp. SJP92 TaxID=1775430 RepID=UPI000787FD4D|nr:CaiB/BaiF CoA-transferase family protein [Flammeovirga sp. SJP92]KXX70578.1 acyl-CoA transferase [Flammeovirga sp. SJP92]
MKPLQDVLIIDLSQYLSGPCCTLKLADLGARVIKVEKPETGDSCRSMYISNVNMNGESSIFRAINRNKESFCADLKNNLDKKKVLQLISKADVLVHNFRPGVIQRLGLDYDTVKVLNPNIVYGEISGYGTEGPWKKKPGQDLLIQAISGVTTLSGNANKGPVPLGLAMADMLSGGHLAQGILAGLVQKGKTGKGCKVSVNMLESMLDLQFETVTTFYHDGGQPTQRTESNNAHAYLGAPYGIYETSNGFLSLAMGAIPKLGELLDCPDLLEYQEFNSWYDQRDEIKQKLANHLKTNTTEHWLSILEPADIWCADVMNWERLFEHDGFKVLDMLQTVEMSDNYQYQTTRCPIKIDGKVIKNTKGSPFLGENNDSITTEFL